MRSSDFEHLINLAVEPATLPGLQRRDVLELYQLFDQAEAKAKMPTAARGRHQEELQFRFEQIRIAVALALMNAFSVLGGGHEESRKVMEVLKKALQARSVQEIDHIIHKEAKVFERLYRNLYTNDEGEMLLNLYERTLDAQTRREMDAIISESLKTLEVISNLPEHPDHDHEDDDDLHNDLDLDNLLNPSKN